MRFYKKILFALVLLIFSNGGLKAQTVAIKIDSLFEHHLGITTLSSIVIYTNDTIDIYAHIINNTGTAISDTFLSFSGINGDTSGHDSIINTNSLFFVDTSANQTILSGDSQRVSLRLYNLTGNPLPNLSPTGSSVVIWPVYVGAFSDTAKFTLIYANGSAINNVTNLISLIKCDLQSIYVQFPDVQVRQVELYDATGRRVYEGANDSNHDEVDWSALPASIYILRIRQGDQSAAVKLVHF